MSGTRCQWGLLVPERAAGCPRESVAVFSLDYRNGRTLAVHVCREHEDVVVRLLMDLITAAADRADREGDEDGSGR